jgi:hypothetical protein
MLHIFMTQQECKQWGAEPRNYKIFEGRTPQEKIQYNKTKVYNIKQKRIIKYKN